MTEAQFPTIGVEPPPTIISSIPSHITLVTDDLDNASVREKRPRYRGIILIVLVLGLAVVATAIAVPLLLLIGKRTITTTSTSTITTHTKITTTSTKTTTTDADTSIISQTTANPLIVCSPPYAITPNNTCVNIMIDFDNCGTVGYVCPSNYTSCSVGVCSSAPKVQLRNSTSIWTASINGSVDDKYFSTKLPFNVTLYSTTTDNISVTTNGVLCLGSCSAVYTETTLPTGAFAGATVFGFWDDLYVYSGTSQGIYQATEGTAPNRTLVFEYYCSHYNFSNEYYHFQILFFENQPGVVQMIYFDASDGGITCTIGVQGSGSGPSMMYSYDTPGAVTQNMTLTFDTNAGTYTNATIG